jgi:hypothetical protein
MSEPSNYQQNRLKICNSFRWRFPGKNCRSISGNLIPERRKTTNDLNLVYTYFAQNPLKNTETKIMPPVSGGIFTPEKRWRPTAERRKTKN